MRKHITHPFAPPDNDHRQALLKTFSQREDRLTPHRDTQERLRHQSSEYCHRIESTSKDRSSVVFQSSPATGQTPERPHIDTSAPSLHTPVDIRRSPSIHGHHKSRGELRETSGSPHQRHLSDSLASDLIHRAEATPIDRAVFSPPPSGINQPFSPPKSPLHSIPEDGHSHNFAKGAALAAAGAGAAAMMARDSGPGAKTLGRSKSRTSSLRNLRGSGSLTSPYDPTVEASSSRAPVDGSQSRDRDMADQYVSSHFTDLQCAFTDDVLQEGYGNYPGSPMSPTRLRVSPSDEVCSRSQI